MFARPINSSLKLIFMLKKQLFTITLGLLLSAASFAQTAKVQVIHNCADTAAAQVDVYINGVLTLDNFGFRKATPFLDLPANININVGIALANSASFNDTLVSFNYNLSDTGKYIMIATGILSDTGYVPAQPFNLAVFPAGQLNSGNSANTNILVYHGATDAPTIDIKDYPNTLVNDISYSEFSTDYIQLPTSNYVIHLTNASGVFTFTLGSYNVPLATLNLQGASLVALASGFLNPLNNSNGASFGIWVALPAGGDLIELPLTTPTTGRVQLIHNSADVAASVVDIWLNDSLLIDNFNFRESTPFMNLPASQEFSLLVKTSSSTSSTPPLAAVTYYLDNTKTYILIAQGNVSTTGYDPIQPFTIAKYDLGRETASSPANTDVLVFHGGNDAPVIDVMLDNNIVEQDLFYGEFTNDYFELPTANYVINAKEGFGVTILASYSAPLATLNLQGEALVVVASGFINTGVNSNGQGFGLWASLPAGGNLVALPVVTSIENNNIAELLIYPNPANDQLNLSNPLFASEKTVITIYNQVGQIVLTQQIQANSSAVSRLDVGSLATGFYTVELLSNQTKITSKVSIIR